MTRALLVALTIVAASAPPAIASELTGIWMRDDGSAKLRFSACGGGTMCGFLAWKKESGGAWPMYPSSAGNAAPVGLVERAGDEIYFRALRAFDRFTAFVYCYAPIGILRKYRGTKTQPSASAPPETALSQAPNRN